VEEARAGDLVAVLQEVRKSGKALHIGISSTLPHISEYIAMGVFESFQVPYSGLERRHEDAISKAAQSGAGVIVRGGVARGEPGAGLGAADRWDVFAKAKLDELLAPGEDRTGFLLRFTISHPGVHTVIVGTRNTDHLASNVKAIQAGKLPPDVYEEAKRRLTQAGEKPEQGARPLAGKKPPEARAPKAALKSASATAKRKVPAKEAARKPAAAKKTAAAKKPVAGKKPHAGKKAPKSSSRKPAARKRAPAKKRK
jgi:diketogulonate reductase-like aldo/keto reductase